MIFRDRACAVLMCVALCHGAPVPAQTRPENAVPAPWQDVRVQGLQIDLTGKHVSVSPDGWLEQVSVDATPLLYAPVSVSIGGRPVAMVGSTPEFVSRSGGDRAESRFKVGATVRGRAIQLSLDIAVEFDGLITFALSADDWPVELRGEPVKYRFAMSSSRFLHRWGAVGERNVDLESAPAVLTMPYVPFAWLGDDARGLFWFAESAAGWRNAAEPGAIRIFKEGAHWWFEATVIPSFSGNAWSHRFGFLPTPVKPLPTNWRRARLYPAAGATGYVIWPQEKQFAAPYFGYPSSSQPRALRTYMGNLARARIRGLPYACPTWIATTTPEWQRHRDEWTGGVADESFEGSVWGGSFVNVCAARESWRTFVRERFGSFIREHRLAGLYMDNAQAYATRGCVDPSDESGSLEFPLLAQRDVYRYVVNELRVNSPDTMAVVHSSGGLNLPSFSTVDAWVNGEQYRGRVQRDYLEVASLTDFRVELNAAKWGIAPIFLPEFPAEIAKEVAPTRKLMSLLLLHDARPWPLWANVEEINRGLSMLDTFGVDDATFVPYYARQPVARASRAGLYVSGYRRGDATLLIAANLNETAVRDRLCLSQPSTLRTWPEREDVATVGDCIAVEVPAGAYRMFVAQRAGQER